MNCERTQASLFVHSPRYWKQNDRCKSGLQPYAAHQSFFLIAYQPHCQSIRIRCPRATLGLEHRSPAPTQKSQRERQDHLRSRQYHPPSGHRPANDPDQHPLPNSHRRFQMTVQYHHPCRIERAHPACRRPGPAVPGHDPCPPGANASADPKSRRSGTTRARAAVPPGATAPPTRTRGSSGPGARRRTCRGAGSPGPGAGSRAARQ